MSLVVVLVPTFDDVDLLEGALRSAGRLGLPSIAMDGAWRLYCERATDLTATPGLGEAFSDWFAADPQGFSGALVVSPDQRELPFSSEADKRQRLVHHALALGHEWGLFLDADEVLESPLGAETLALQLQGRLVDGVDWALLERFQEQPFRGTERIPRLLRLAADLRFQPPLDYDVYRGDRRIAHHDVQQVPSGRQREYCTVPNGVLRIRHDRHLRPQERFARQARYLQRRAKESGA